MKVRKSFTRLLCKLPVSTSSLAFILMIVATLAYILTFGLLSLLRHWSLGSNAFDLGNMDQAAWNTLHGNPLRFTADFLFGEIRLAIHVEPVMFAIAPLYLIYSGPETLLILQTLALAFGAWPLFLLARRRLESDLAALALAASYLLMPALEAVNLFDFHPLALAPAFVLWAFYFLERRGGEGRDALWFLLLMLLAMSCREDVALLVATSGIYAGLVYRRKKTALAGLITGIVWFYLTVQVIIPTFRLGAYESPYLSYYRHLGRGPMEIALNLLTHPRLMLEIIATPENAKAMAALLLPFMGIPIFGLPLLLVAAPAFAVILFSANPLTHELEKYHYAAYVAPFVALAALHGLDWASRFLGLKPQASRKLHLERRYVLYALSGWMLTCALIYHHIRGFSPLAMPFQLPQVTAHHLLLREVSSTIPPDAIIAAQDALFPHFSQRKTVHLWPFVRDAEYIILDVSHPRFHNLHRAHDRLREEIINGKDFGLIASRDGYLILKRGEIRQPLSDEFYDFARAENPQIQYPMAVDFGDDLRFLGFDILYNREDDVYFNLYWQAREKLKEDLFISLYLVDVGGDVVGSSDISQPSLIWYPTSRWEPGETVRVLANTFTWWTGDRDEYRVALGVMRGEDTWDVGARLRPRVAESTLVPRLRADRTLLELMRFRRVWGMPRALEERRLFTSPHIQYKQEAGLGGKVMLIGYDLSPATLRPGQKLRLTLYWQAQAEMEKSYTIFTHLLDESGVWRGGHDGLPDGGARPTETWKPGEYVADMHEIIVPQDAPAGEYHIEVGMYEVATGERLGGGSIVLDRKVRLTRISFTDFTE
ncbi:MAG: DUF2079 domain-containing protein [Anaerolineae bacterium]